jgi:phosphate transport system protein
MVMSFFRRSDESGLEHVAHQTISMLGDARHTFDLASAVVLGGADPSTVGDDIEATDRRINESEQRLRSELVVHVAVQGSADIGVVLGYILLLKKIERIGDQAKNIYELSGEGVSFIGADDVDEFVAQQQEISRLYVEAGELLGQHDDAAAKDFVARSLALNERCGEKVLEYMHSERPGSWAVPRAVLYRYWKRIVANLAGIVTSSIEPIQHIDYLDDGAVDIDDD